MSGHRWALALAAAVAIGAFGALPQGKEPEELKPVAVLAVDGGEGFAVTAVTAVRSSEEEAPEVWTGAGDSLTAACGDLRGNSSRRAYLGQTQQLLVGEGTGLEEIFRFVIKHPELRLDTLLYIVRGNAGAALAASAELTAGENGGQDFRGVTVGEVLPRLTQGEHALVPALAPDGEGKLAPSGWAVLCGGAVAGYLEGEAELGATLLLGKAAGRGVTLPGGGVELISARCWAMDGVLRCSLVAQVCEGDPTGAELAAWGERCLRATLDAGWDCWGLDRELAALRPWDWEALRGMDIRGLEVKGKGKLVG